MRECFDAQDDVLSSNNPGQWVALLIQKFYRGDLCCPLTEGWRLGIKIKQLDIVT